ncbi:uncharacterized protein LOC124132114 [Haliotis rufescens]|uniref:uncharacterized protein LOC124132114 n=1 Tax=Haliotis rufescens TaxID=6454 RepID=UPI00201EA54B|nr:uncharacterized protein LOC124132114 [Haliotis rufescens]
MLSFFRVVWRRESILLDPRRGNDFMTSHNSTLPIESSPTVSLLWLPYVLIATVFIVFLGINFWCYHKRNRERYLRKRDEKRVKDGLYERRRIIALMRAQFQVKLPSANQDMSPRSPGDLGLGLAEVQKREITLDQNGSLLRHSLRESVEDSFDYADDIHSSINDLDDPLYDRSSLKRIMFVSSVCSTDMSGGGNGQSNLLSKRGMSGDNGSVHTVCK